MSDAPAKVLINPVTILDPDTNQPAGAPATDAKIDALIALVGDASDSPGDPTMIGLLKQIVANTAA